MSKRRGNGEGSIYKRNDRRWVGQYLVHTVKALSIATSTVRPAVRWMRSSPRRRLRGTVGSSSTRVL